MRLTHVVAPRHVVVARIARVVVGVDLGLVAQLVPRTDGVGQRHAQVEVATVMGVDGGPPRDQQVVVGRRLHPAGVISPPGDQRHLGGQRVRHRRPVAVRVPLRAAIACAHPVDEVGARRRVPGPAVLVHVELRVIGLDVSAPPRLFLLRAALIEGVAGGDARVVADGIRRGAQNVHEHLELDPAVRRGDRAELPDDGPLARTGVREAGRVPDVRHPVQRVGDDHVLRGHPSLVPVPHSEAEVAALAGRPVRLLLDRQVRRRIRWMDAHLVPVRLAVFDHHILARLNIPHPSVVAQERAAVGIDVVDADPLAVLLMDVAPYRDQVRRQPGRLDGARHRVRGGVDGGVDGAHPHAGGVDLAAQQAVDPIPRDDVRIGRHPVLSFCHEPDTLPPARCRPGRQRRAGLRGRAIAFGEGDRHAVTSLVPAVHIVVVVVDEHDQIRTLEPAVERDLRVGHHRPIAHLALHTSWEIREQGAEGAAPIRQHVFLGSLVRIHGHQLAVQGVDLAPDRVRHRGSLGREGGRNVDNDRLSALPGSNRHDVARLEPCGHLIVPARFAVDPLLARRGHGDRSAVRAAPDAGPADVQVHIPDLASAEGHHLEHVVSGIRILGRRVDLHGIRVPAQGFVGIVQPDAQLDLAAPAGLDSLELDHELIRCSRLRVGAAPAVPLDLVPLHT